MKLKIQKRSKFLQTHSRSFQSISKKFYSGMRIYKNKDLEKILENNYSKIVDMQEKAFLEYHNKKIKVPSR